MNFEHPYNDLLILLSSFKLLYLVSDSFISLWFYDVNDNINITMSLLIKHFV